MGIHSYPVIIKQPSIARRLASRESRHRTSWHPLLVCDRSGPGPLGRSLYPIMRFAIILLRSPRSVSFLLYRRYVTCKALEHRTASNMGSHSIQTYIRIYGQRTLFIVLDSGTYPGVQTKSPWVSNKDFSKVPRQEEDDKWSPVTPQKTPVSACGNLW